MTWNGDLGFQHKPNTSIEITLPDLQYQDVFEANGLEGYDGPGQGIMGVQVGRLFRVSSVYRTPRDPGMGGGGSGTGKGGDEAR
jgi:hypothetical protein